MLDRDKMRLFRNIYPRRVYLSRVDFVVARPHGKPEWISHHSTRNNIRKNDTGLTGTMHYDVFRSITLIQTVLLHSIHCKHQFRKLQYIIFVYTN